MDKNTTRLVHSKSFLDDVVFQFITICGEYLGSQERRYVENVVFFCLSQGASVLKSRRAQYNITYSVFKLGQFDGNKLRMLILLKLMHLCFILNKPTKQEGQ